MQTMQFPADREAILPNSKKSNESRTGKLRHKHFEIFKRLKIPVEIEGLKERCIKHSFC
jgi:hypothetical protein